MNGCGLIGKSLSHSFSPLLHSFFGDYPYRLFEMEEKDLGAFLEKRAFSGINVTIPYKKAVLPFLDTLSPTAQRLGCVNTIVKREDGSLFGHNTDYFGFSYMLEKSGIPCEGKKVLVLGSGGASATVCAVLEDKGAHVVVISRQGENNYENLWKHADAEVIVNTTPLGMYPHAGVSPLSLAKHGRCIGVLDLIYNPSKTALLLEAESLGIPHANGLSMLVAQGKESAEYFSSRPIPHKTIETAISALSKSQKNIVLIGMPGAGKTTLGKKLAEKTGRVFFDADEEIIKEAGMSIPSIFEAEGEAGFRRRETEVLQRLGQQRGLVLATGGGCVTKEENYPLLHQNGILFWIQRDISTLPKEGRPLSLSGDIEKLYRARAPLYARFADIEIENRFEAGDITERVIEAYENFSD